MDRTPLDQALDKQAARSGCPVYIFEVSPNPRILYRGSHATDIDLDTASLLKLDP